MFQNASIKLTYNVLFLFIREYFLCIGWEKWLETKLECPLCKSRVRKK